MAALAVSATGAGADPRVESLGTSYTRAMSDGVRYVASKPEPGVLKVLDTKRGVALTAEVGSRCDVTDAASGAVLLRCLRPGETSSVNSLYRVYYVRARKLVDVPVSTPLGVDGGLSSLGRYWLRGDSCRLDPHALRCQEFVVNWRTGQELLGRDIDLDIAAPTAYRAEEHDTVVSSGYARRKLSYRPKGSGSRKILLTRRSSDLSDVQLGGGYVTWLERAGEGTYIYRYTIRTGRRVRWLVKGSPDSLTVRHTREAVFVSVRLGSRLRWRVLRATEPLRAPSVVSLTIRRAAERLAARGLRWRYEGDDTVFSQPLPPNIGRSTDDDRVVAQEPQPGAPVVAKAVVVLSTKCTRLARDPSGPRCW